MTPTPRPPLREITEPSRTDGETMTSSRTHNRITAADVAVCILTAACVIGAIVCLLAELGSI